MKDVMEEDRKKNSSCEVNCIVAKVFCSDSAYAAEASIIPTSAKHLNEGTRSQLGLDKSCV